MFQIFRYTPLTFFAQSFWRDEAFTYLLAQNSIINILVYTAKDYNPPLYYLIMHIWMFIFGHSEIAMRSVSLICYWATLYVAYLFMTECMGISMKKALMYLALFFFNPILIYYAYEARMYTMFAFMSTLSFYAFYKNDRKLYLWSTIAGLYTHYFMIFVLVCQLLHLMVFHRKKPDLKVRLNYITVAFAAFIPWILFVLFQAEGYKEHFWIDPPALKTILYVPAQMYTGYELGDRFLAIAKTQTAPFLIALSTVLLLTIIYGLINVIKHGTEKQKSVFAFLAIWALVPSFGLFLMSLYKPLFLTRYIIFASVGLLLLVVYSLQTMRRQYALIVFGVLIIMTLYYQKLQIKHYAKDNLAATIAEMKSIANKNDVLYVTDVLQFHVAQYYFDKDKVYIFNKSYNEIPRYVGKILIPADRTTTQLPIYPVKAFVLYEDGHYDIRSGY
ncbi:MAG: putative rane protein [Candidatus Parcubacteria bacterium]|jgi:uncharacterized membrane protein